VHNVLVNARAHGHPEAEPLRVRVTREGDRVRFAVEDRGPGFPPGLAERAFEPFVRGEPSRTRPAAGAGYGLGLAIVRRIVEAHGGRAFAHNVGDTSSVRLGGLGGAAALPPNATIGGAAALPPSEGASRAQGALVGFDLPAAPSAR
jgi:signal transduction histidine kinase